ncbi:hypothetical protein FH972_008436 [Carpinus fangiana]|uniref:Uncharacterized protein n=1 Tax=Carpinus fangiana TaxID=176857 RepID=A0A5N6QYM6_9ROSI|nr:hypothetical protein FH972_008436 [Carpinus fangiana]
MVDSWKIESLVALQWAWVWVTIVFDWWRTPDRSSKSRSLRELEREAEAMSRSLCMWSLPPEKSEKEPGEEPSSERFGGGGGEEEDVEEVGDRGREGFVVKRRGMVVAAVGFIWAGAKRCSSTGAHPYGGP